MEFRLPGEGKKVSFRELSPPGNLSPDVLFIHGIGGNLRHWMLQMNELGKKRRVVGVDLPGHGGTSGPAYQEIEEYLPFLDGCLEALRLEKPVLVGHSMGGAISLNYALQRQERLAGLALLSTSAKLPLLDELLAKLKTGQPCPELADYLYAPGSPPELVEAAKREILALGPEVFYNGFLTCGHYDIRKRLQEIALPCLVLCGREDRMTPPSWSEALARGLPDSRLEILGGCSHMLLLEQPERVNALLDDFLEDLAKKLK